MEIALWIGGIWLGLTVAVSVWVAAFIRRERGTDTAIPVSAGSAVSRQDHAVSRP